VALCETGHVLAETDIDCGRHHTERLLETLDWLLRQTNLQLADLDGLAVSVGPGSFTGVRVGVAACKGLALGAGLPLVGVSTLDALARCAGPAEGVVCPVLDAKMGEVFANVYDVTTAKAVKRGNERVCRIEDLVETLEGGASFLGDGAVLYRDRIEAALPGAVVLGQRFAVPRASAVAAEAFALLESGCAGDPADVMPVYLRMSQAEEARVRAGIP
jgi:tRNA threonylcarbamoyl adenosine modification protein YeaZ